MGDVEQERQGRLRRRHRLQHDQLVFDNYKPNAPKLVRQERHVRVRSAGSKSPSSRCAGGGSRRDGAQRFLVEIPVADTPGKVASRDLLSDRSPGRPHGQWESDGTASMWDDDHEPAQGPATHDDANRRRPPQVGNFAEVRGLPPDRHRKYEKVGPEWVMTGFFASLYDADDPSYFDYKGDGNTEWSTSAARTATARAQPHPRRPRPGQIVNPAKLTAVQQLEICASATRAQVTPNRTFSFPYKDER